MLRGPEVGDGRGYIVAQDQCRRSEGPWETRQHLASLQCEEYDQLGSYTEPEPGPLTSQGVFPGDARGHSQTTLPEFTSVIKGYRHDSAHGHVSDL